LAEFGPNFGVADAFFGGHLANEGLFQGSKGALASFPPRHDVGGAVTHRLGQIVQHIAVIGHLQGIGGSGKPGGFPGRYQGVLPSLAQIRRGFVLLTHAVNEYETH
jgi:hypothetical protein